MAMSAAMACIGLLAALLSINTALALSGGPYHGDGTHYGKGGDWNGWCKGFGKGNGWPGVPTAAMNAPQFANGDACGVCISGYGTGKGAGYTPIVGNFFITINNLCPECAYGNIDFCDDGDGRWEIIWYVVDCASHGRHLLENNVTVNEFLGDIMRPSKALNASIESDTVNTAGARDSGRAAHTHRMLQLPGAL